MHTLQDKTVAIIGGGPGGLTLARLLQLGGANVKVYERSPSDDARPSGATLDLHEESGLAALRAAGLTAAFTASYRPGAEKMRITDQRGVIAWDDHALAHADRARPEIDRGPLQKILLQSLQPGTVVWDRQFLALAPQAGGWQVQFKHGPAISADLVIGADGANSKVRPYLTPIRPFYADVTVIEGAVHNSAKHAPKMHALLRDGKIFAFGGERSLIVSSKGDGSLVFYAGFKTDEHWAKYCRIDFSDKVEVLAWFKAEFSDWAEIWQELFLNAHVPFVPRPQYCMPLDQTWPTSPNLTLLGDAAHLMPPYAGEGVNLAMLDALELSTCLLSDAYPDTTSAITAYEGRMRRRASETARLTLESTEALHSPGAVAFLVGIIS